MITRRNLLAAILAAGAAPAIVRAGSIMRINPRIVVPENRLVNRLDIVVMNIIPFDITKFLADESVVIEYLTAAREEGMDTFLAALDDVAKARKAEADGAG